MRTERHDVSGQFLALGFPRFGGHNLGGRSLWSLRMRSASPIAAGRRAIPDPDLHPLRVATRGETRMVELDTRLVIGRILRQAVLAAMLTIALTLASNPALVFSESHGPMLASRDLFV